jgi:hypothetical protein
MVLPGPAPLRGQQADDEAAFREETLQYRQERDRSFRSSPFSPLALVHREYLKGSTRLILGSSPKAKLRLAGEGVAPLHAVIEGPASGPVLRPLGRAVIRGLEEGSPGFTELALKDNTGFRLGRYNLRYILHSSWGPTLEVYDSQHPALVNFAGLDYFPPDLAFRVTGKIVPREEPQPLELIDSQGNKRPYWLYAELRFQLQGEACRLEVYAPSLDPAEIQRDGYMLMFTDATSGQESYPAARYLYVEGKPAGHIQVDFNKAFSPPCNYSPVFTCPFPRPQNRLQVAVRAGQKWYRKQAGEPAGNQ